MLTINWAAAAVAVVLWIAGAQTFRRARQSPDNLDERFGELLARTRAAIEADEILPAIARLVAEVRRRVLPEVILTADDDEFGRLVRENLQGTSYLDDVKTLTELASDHGATRSLFDRAGKWAAYKGRCALVFLVGLTYGAIWTIVDGHEMPRVWFVTAMMVAAVGAIGSVICWLRESDARNGLVRLSQAHLRGVTSG